MLNALHPRLGNSGSFFIYLYEDGAGIMRSWQELLQASILLEIEIADPSSMTGLAPVICNCVLVDGWCFIYNAGIIIKLLLLLLTDDAGKKWTVIIIKLCNGTRSKVLTQFYSTFKSIDKCVAVEQRSFILVLSSSVVIRRRWGRRHQRSCCCCALRCEADEKRWSEINGEGCFASEASPHLSIHSFASSFLEKTSIHVS